MTDQYQAFSKSPIGKFVIKNLGLPAPTFLERFESATPVVKGAVLVGAATNSTLSGSIAQVLANVHANGYAGNNAQLQQVAAKAGLNLSAFNDGDKESKFKVVIFDASGIENSEQLHELYAFFNPIARQIQASGRVVILGTTPETASTVKQAIAHVLARDGAHVICLDVPQQQADLDRVAAKIGGSTLAIDITAADAGQKIKDAATVQGGLDIIVHNAGITRDKTLANMKPELWDLVININLSAIERVNDYLLENDGFNANGRIVCVSSISGIAGNLGQTNYAASKAGVIGVVKFTAPVLKNGVTINAVAPGFIETQMTAAIPFAIREAGRRMNSMSQGGLPIDVAETIAMFASTASTGLNGNVVRVCGQSLLGA